jgi:hypothetical protein
MFNASCRAARYPKWFVRGFGRIRIVGTAMIGGVSPERSHSTNMVMKSLRVPFRAVQWKLTASSGSDRSSKLPEIVRERELSVSYHSKIACQGPEERVGTDTPLLIDADMHWRAGYSHRCRFTLLTKHECGHRAVGRHCPDSGTGADPCKSAKTRTPNDSSRIQPTLTTVVLHTCLQSLH